MTRRSLSSFRRNPGKKALKHSMQLRFNSEEWNALLSFTEQVNYNPKDKIVSLTDLCKKAIFMTINKAYATASKLAEQAQKEADTTNGTGDLNNEAIQGITEGNNSEGQGQDTSSNPLANEAAPTVEGT